MAHSLFTPTTLPTACFRKPSFPPEYTLWQELRTRTYVSNASHFYSDDDFLHQLFVEKPHRIIYDNQIREPDVVQRIRATGGHFFFVLHSGSAVQLFIASAFPEMKQERIGEFLVYFP